MWELRIMVAVLHKATKAQSRNKVINFDPVEAKRGEAPTSLREALVRDLGEARKTPGIGRHVNDRIAVDCDVRPDTVYDWKSDNHVWSLAHIKAVLMHTGGHHFRAMANRLALRGSACRPAESLQQCIALVNLQTASINAQVAEDLSLADDTPGAFDHEERRRLRQMIAKAHAELERLSLALEEN
jgi:hypothetical protein